MHLYKELRVQWPVSYAYGKLITFTAGDKMRLNLWEMFQKKLNQNKKMLLNTFSALDVTLKQWHCLSILRTFCPSVLCPFARPSVRSSTFVYQYNSNSFNSSTFFFTQKYKIYPFGSKCYKFIYLFYMYDHQHYIPASLNYFFPILLRIFFSWDKDTEISDDAPLFNIYPRDVRQHFYCRDGIT